jgi:MFS family permease
MSSSLHASMTSNTDDVEAAHKSDLVVEPTYENPRDWSVPKKIMSTAIVCIMTLALTYSSSAYSSSNRHIIEQFGISQTVGLLGISLFVAGFASGPLLFGPLAHVFGHRPVFIATYISFTAMLFGAAEAPNVGSLIVFRFLAGVFGSSSINNAPAAIGDWTTPANANKYMLFYALNAFGGPGLGPVFGSLVDHRAGWRWNLRVQAIFAGVMTVICIVFLSESSHIVLQKRAAEKSNKSQDTPSQRDKLVALRKTMKVALSGPFVWLFTEPVVMIICFYLSLLYTVLYLTFVVVPLSFQGKRGFGQESNGLIFISLLVGFLLAAFIFAILQQRYTLNQIRLLKPGEQLSPESKLKQAIWASILPPIGLFIFAWTAPFPHIHWIVPCLGLMILTLGMFILFTSFIPYLVAFGGNSAPLLLAASTSTRSLMAAAFPLFAVQMFDKMTIQGGCSMLGGVALLLVPTPLVLTRYGAAIRARSKK